MAEINKLFKAVADPTRREIFHLLIMTTSALSITQISGHFDMSRQGVTKHLGFLADAGLVSIQNSGRERYCTANPKPLSQIKDWVAFYDSFWDDKLNRLDDHLSEDQA